MLAPLPSPGPVPSAAGQNRQTLSSPGPALPDPVPSFCLLAVAGNRCDRASERPVVRERVGRSERRERLVVVWWRTIVGCLQGGREGKMERKAVVVCAVVGFLGVLSAALGFAAEATRVKVRLARRLSPFSCARYAAGVVPYRLWPCLPPPTPRGRSRPLLGARDRSSTALLMPGDLHACALRTVMIPTPECT